MKRLLTLILVILTLSCSDEQENTIIIVNQFSESLDFHFRGESFRLAFDEKVVLNNVPIGNYEYSTSITEPKVTYYLTDPITGAVSQAIIPLKFEGGVEDSNLEGEFTINRGGTNIQVFYTGFISLKDENFTVRADITSNISTPIKDITK